ncbi:MAG: DUF2318 domain-containing protein [Patescibacteria group bacterium]
MQKTFSIIIVLTVLILVGCAEVDLSEAKTSISSKNLSPATNTSEFRGTAGDSVELVDAKVTLDVTEVEDGQAHFYNTTLPDGDPVYFFVVKSPDGSLRAAANGCQVCGGALQGFRQEGDFMVCNTCGNRYPLDKIATEKGGCNPAPINPDLKIEDGKISISLTELKNIKHFFE